MGLKMHKWLVYTVIVGLIPMIGRLFIYSISEGGGVEFISSSDIIAFGLILHISNINELEHIDDQSAWKTWANGLAIAFLAIYSVSFTAVVSIEGGVANFNAQVVRSYLMVIAGVSFTLCAVFSYRASKYQAVSQQVKTERAGD
ncbi:hypothetical protein [Oceanospirillum maris]|uniref:hypothetical protein n=1 Tax=Oceanospirillum maris TaxID=64977 RepID=UPI00055ED177|nr:hypothetical protein [Oceanospirillum maris]